MLEIKDVDACEGDVIGRETESEVEFDGEGYTEEASDGTVSSFSSKGSGAGLWGEGVLTTKACF